VHAALDACLGDRPRPPRPFPSTPMGRRDRAQ
jgi:hypothetical protein